LAVLPWELYESLLELADIASDPRALMQARPETRQRALTLAAVQAERLYSMDRDLTDFDAFGEEDFFDATE
jgi:hypothetical protein